MAQRITTVVLMLAVIASACGGSDSSDSTPATTEGTAPTTQVPDNGAEVTTTPARLRPRRRHQPL